MRNQPTIYFIRHGETDWNRDRRYQGQREPTASAFHRDFVKD